MSLKEGALLQSCELLCRSFVGWAEVCRVPALFSMIANYVPRTTGFGSFVGSLMRTTDIPEKLS